MEIREKMSEAMRECIDECTMCHEACVATMTHCLEMGGEHANPEHIGLLRNCALICQTSADFMISGSPYHKQVCGVCAQICEACAESCEQFEDDSMMKECAKACRSCAESCYEMAA